MNNQPLYRNNLLDKPAELRKEIKRKIPVPIPLQNYKTRSFSTPDAVNPAEVQVCYIPPHQRPLDSSRISKFSKYQDKKNHLPFSFNA